LLGLLRSTAAGLTSDEARRRLRLHGPNSFVRKQRFAALLGFLRFFANPLVIILLVASAVSLSLGDRVGGLIIIAMVLLSVLLNFFMEFQARHAVEEIQKQVATMAAALRDGRERDLPIAERLAARPPETEFGRGRRCFANIMKYIIMGTSSNFGNMFSMAAASLFLPMLPMLPTQILLNNFLYDSSQISIPGDNVDSALLRRPKRWQIGFILRFMTIIGPISSIYDFLTFGVLFWGFHASTNAPLFRTGWFVESLATQTLVVFVIRTAGNPLKSRPSRSLLISVLAVVAIAAVLPYTPLGSLLRFVPPPVTLLATIAGLALTYLLLVQAVKTWFYRRHALL
jgi:magnesium-transporting ATPase (P-type)